MLHWSPCCTGHHVPADVLAGSGGVRGLTVQRAPWTLVPRPPPRTATGATVVDRMAVLQNPSCARNVHEPSSAHLDCHLDAVEHAPEHGAETAGAQALQEGQARQLVQPGRSRRLGLVKALPAARVGRASCPVSHPGCAGLGRAGLRPCKRPAWPCLSGSVRHARVPRLSGPAGI